MCKAQQNSIAVDAAGVEVSSADEAVDIRTYGYRYPYSYGYGSYRPAYGQSYSYSPSYGQTNTYRPSNYGQYFGSDPYSTNYRPSYTNGYSSYPSSSNYYNNYGYGSNNYGYGQPSAYGNNYYGNGNYGYKQPYSYGYPSYGSTGYGLGYREGSSKNKATSSAIAPPEAAGSSDQIKFE